MPFRPNSRWLLGWGLGFTLLTAAGSLWAEESGSIALPQPWSEGGVSLESVLAGRHSQRGFQSRALSREQVGQLLWAAQGITHGGGRRAAPSAGVRYPLELYLVLGTVQGIGSGVYHYVPAEHRLTFVSDDDLRGALGRAAANQRWLASAPLVVVVAADVSRSRDKYGARAERYVAMEAGAAAENLWLQAQAMGLGTVLLGAFDDAGVARLLQLPDGQVPLAIMPVGWPPD